MQEKFKVTGMSCSACSSGIERAVSKLEGVRRAEVSLIGESLSVDYDETLLPREKIENTVRDLGYGVEEFDAALETSKTPQPKKIKYRFWISLCLLIPLMYFSMGGMIGLPQPPPLLGDILQAVLAAAIAFLNAKFFVSGTRAALKGVPNMDTLVALGSFASYAYSLVITVLSAAGLTAHGHLFYESSAMILTLVTLGKWLEERSKKRTGDEVEKLIRLMPSEVVRETNEGTEIIPFSSVAVGDLIVVKQGDYIPIDGTVVEGHAFIDRAAITGESMPVEVTVGASVTGADIVKSGYLKVRAERVGADTSLSQIVKMVKEAGASKAPIQKIADKVAGVFVPVVVMIALATFLLWWLVGGSVVNAVNYSVCVLVISCPCSLGLATPVAVVAATGRGMSLGVLFKDAEALQKARSITKVLLDKTATLTEGKAKVTDFTLYESKGINALAVAAAIEEKSNHPIAACILEYAEGKSVEKFEAEDYRYETGKGAVARVGGQIWYLGNRRLLPDRVAKAADEIERKNLKSGKTIVYLASEETVVATFAIADELKPTSKTAVTELGRRGVSVGMLTGDSASVANAIAERVGIVEYHAEILPQEKAAAVVAAKSNGGVVAMVGDGVNDSPALKAADLGVAMGAGTDIAIDSADVVLVRGDLRTLSTMIDLSKAAMRNVKQNLFWALFYNCIAIPVAAGALSFAGLTLNPMLAAACMSLSSLFVVTNALRLTRFGKKEEKNEEKNKMKTLKIEGMMCPRCVAHVEKALKGVDGVTTVEVNLKKGTATVEGDNLSIDLLTAAIVEAGYEVKGVK